jgi:crossover junction endodeoxyribonuclease RusA
MKLTFVVPGPPQPKQRARRGKGNRWYTPRATRTYEAKVCLFALSALGRRRWSRSGRYALTLRQVFGDARRRDADNVAKAIQDALNGVAWDDDSQVVRLTCTREIDRKNPRVEVTIERSDDDGR